MKGLLLASLAFLFIIKAFPQNNPPVAVNDTVEVMAQVPVLIDALANDYDPDGDGFYFETIGNPLHGEIDTVEGKIWYRSNCCVTYDQDHFNYKIIDNGSPPALSGYAGIKINIQINPDVPVSNPDTFICTQLVPTELDILANDTDFNGDELKINEIRFTDNCQVEISNDSLSVTVLSKSEYSIATFSYNVIESGTSEAYISYTCQVRIGLMPNPDIPKTVNDSTSTTGGIPVLVPVLENDYDRQGDEFEILNIGSPGVGTANIIDHALQIIPNISFKGKCTFSYNVYQLSKPYMYSNYAYVTVDVLKNPDCPVGLPDTVRGMKCTDITINALVNDFDINGDPLEIWDIRSPNGTDSISGNNIIYRSTQYANDLEILEYRVRQSNDEDYYSEWTPVLIYLEDNPEFPVAVNDHYTVNSMFPMLLSPLDNDIRNTADTLIVTFANGYFKSEAFAISDSQIFYQPYTNVRGLDSVFYIISDKNNPDLRSAAKIYLEIADLHYYDSLTINNINAGVNADGMLFGDVSQLPGQGMKSDFEAHFRYPNGTKINTVFNSTFWIGGITDDDSLHFAGERFRQIGADFQPGPVSGSYDSIYASRFWRLWKLRKSDIDYHRNHWSQQSYQPINDIMTWPGNGNPEAGQAINLASYVDFNQDGKYDPMYGDYPVIRGDECIFFMMNDDMVHTESEGNRLKTEVHGMVYEFDAPEDSILSNTVFVHYDLINRSVNEYHDTYIGIFTDFELGNPFDNFIGSDVFRNSYYCFNGDDLDEDYGDYNPESGGYGKYSPAQSVTILSGPLMDIDGVDNPSGGCDFSFNGQNFGNDKADDERYGLTGFYYRNYYGPQPTSAIEYYLMLNGFWPDSTKLQFGGNMHNSNPLAVGPACLYTFPGNSDSINFGTGCLPPNPPYNQNGFYWTDSNTNSPGNRHGLGCMGPFTLKPGDVQEIELAYVVANGWNGPVSSVNKLMEYIDTLRYRVSQGEIIIPNDQLGLEEDQSAYGKMKIFPNPGSDFVCFTLEGINDPMCEYAVYDVFGRIILSGKSKKKVDIKGLSPGFYILAIQKGNHIYSGKFIKKNSN